MGLWGAVGLSLALASLIQIPWGAEACNILSAKASGPSSILVKWAHFAGATNYFLDFRVRNNTNIAPVVVTLPSTQTERDVKGLRPGTQYNVTLKVFQFYFVVCVDTYVATTVPDTSQITDGWAISSTSIRIQWTRVPSADYYYVLVQSQATRQTLNMTFTNTSAVVTKLQPSTNYDCYVYTANSAGVGSQSKVKTVTTLMNPPGNISVTQTSWRTVSVSWQPVQGVLIYQVKIQVTDDPTSQPSAYNISDTHLSVQDILPCSTYLISVSSFNNFLMLSESRDYTYTTNTLTPVSSVSVDYTCTTYSSIVSWSAVFGAESYKAFAMGDNGTQLTCTSQTTSCQIGGLTCSQSYAVHVIPISGGCTNMINTTSATFQTVPCPPKKLELLRNCSSEVILFSWEYTNNTDYYMAKAVDSQGVVQECVTQDNSCYFTSTVCGRHYYFTVFSIRGECRSQISSTVDIRTAPCIPKNLQTSADCRFDVLLSKWDLAEGALRYTVEAFGNKGRNNYNCSSMSNSCAIEGTQCDDYFSVYITAFDDECSSPRTLGALAETIPCAPYNVSAVKECGADSITVSWSGESAMFYVAVARESNGVVHSCNSMDSSCTIKGLKCSTNYTAYVIASNFMCNSSESETVTIETASCPPDEVVASLDCSANQALISWHGQPHVTSYTAIITDEEQGLLSCSSINTSCSIPNLKCGQLYTVIVSHHEGTCPSMPSKPTYMESVPCGPGVNFDLDCRSQVLTLGLKTSATAAGYVAVISNSVHRVSYNTTEPTLRIGALECGVDYSLTVMSFNGTCVSQPTQLPAWQTPCVPTNVVVRGNCSQNFAEVTWQASRGALSYRASATDEDGQQLLCASNETACRLKGLTCSQVYSIGVTASKGNCSSNESAAVLLKTAPCPPSQLNVSMNCANDSASLTWSVSHNALSYTGKAANSEGHTLVCDAEINLHCQLHGLHCGSEYTFTVSSSAAGCQSPDSEPVTLKTAPCAIQNVQSSLNCTTNILTTRWVPGAMPMNYSATALTRNGTAVHCTTEDATCTMPDLQCGEQYSVTVKAVSSACEGHSSVPNIVHSLPCVPVNVQGAVKCSTSTLQASWDPAAGAASYTATLKGAGGFSTSCPSGNQSCLFTGLQCAQTYMLSVMAKGDGCNSAESAVISATTAPCDPTNVAAALQCLSGVVTVTWGAGAGAHYYTVLAEANGHTDSCNSTGFSCELIDLQCGESYAVTVLAGDGKCNSSLLARTNVTTAPCAPVIQNHSLDCISNHALVTWVKDEDAIGVTVNATSSLGHTASCGSSTNTTCVLDELACGHTYVIQAFAQGVQCLSKPSSAFTIVTAPCTPANVSHTYSCETGIASLSWQEPLGAKSFYAHVHSGDHLASCSTNQTRCLLSPVLCGHTYDVEVISVAQHCNSSVSGSTRISSAPCAPANVNTSLVCDKNTATVSWKDSSGAVFYKVMANSSDGDVKQCTTNDTSCHLPSMHCGQTYNITVTPFSNECKGYDSYPLSYNAGPCPPTNVHVSLQCAGNVGHVTWNAATQADQYMVTAVSSAADKHNYTCTSDGTGCSLTGLRCGETTVVTVATVARGCASEPSLPFTFHSVICPPSNLTTATTCSNNDITVNWDQSPESGVSYTVRSHGDDGTTVNYTTTQTSQVVTGLQCGEMYMFSVAASDAECTSVFSQPIQAKTAPCPPTNLTAKANCGSNLGTLNWAPSINAISYTATFTGAHGHVASCSSSTTTCSAKLDCGHQYTATLIASSATCNNRTGPSLTFNSAPCLPDRVVADLDCNANSLAVQWRGSVNKTDTYTALAIGSDSTRASCNTTGTNCTIQSLKCGLTYSIVVITSSVTCDSIEGSDYILQSAPCKPERVQLNLECNTNKALVTWENGGPDQTQVVSAVDSAGAIATCNSTSSNCTFEQLSCGKTYVINVVGHTNTCSGEPVVSGILSTAPCIATHLTAQVDCRTGITAVTWDAARGATSYTVHARGSLGYSDKCNSTDTNCDFRNLACGQDYTVTVLARHDSCVSVMSASINTTTGPCLHSHLKTSLDCNTNTAAVSWTPGSGILYYNASASAFAIAHVQSCSTSNSSCNIDNLQCGESYNVSVSGQGQNCPSPANDWNRFSTAPCAPTQLSVDSSCESNNISVSWRASQGSVSYTAVAENAAGLRWTCNTSSTNCQISALSCGQQYQVYVSGFDEKCIGAKSNVEVIRTAPCVPQNVQNSLDCPNGVLNVTWQSTGYVVQFHASVVSSTGSISSCKTDQHHCSVDNVQCGHTYSVKVLAKDEACNSSYSPAQQKTAAPCPLKNFLPTTDCHTGVVSVSWNESSPEVAHTVLAVDVAGRQHNCTGTTGGCDLSTLSCGTKYNVTVTPSRNGCVGRDSPTKTITTVPCIPHLSSVEIDCLANSTWAMFEESEGAQDYIITATDSLGDTQMYECSLTEDRACSLPPLACSKNLTFTLKAADQQCSSAPSNPVTLETAPCPPEVVEKSVGCDNHTANISWSATPGALTYTATLEQINGSATFCTTSKTSCQVSDLPCGEMFILLVTAEGRTCNSSHSQAGVIRTAPCIPQNLSANLSCSDNVASTSWSYGQALGLLFRVTAVSTDGHKDECTSTQIGCDLTGLLCGRYYTTTALAEHSNCRSKPSKSVTIKTAPCTPANISSEVDCETRSLIVSWPESPGADSYTATVQDSNGQTTTCQGTTEGSCSVLGIACGQIYHTSVVSSDGYCESPPTPEVDTPSVPCNASLIKAVMDCYTLIATVEWYPSDGALRYKVLATTASGHNVACESRTASCELGGLLCGQSYSVSVRAIGENCSSLAHMTGQLFTEPCIPEHFTAQYNLTISQVLWDLSPGAEYYTVKGETQQGLMVSCTTNNTYCAIYSMVCGQMYTISVSAHNHVCQGVSTSNKSVTVLTEPCPPNNVQTSVRCQHNLGTVTWKASFGAVGYMVTLAGRDGHSLSCYTNNTFCHVEGLNCGVTYYTNVIAIGEVFNSSSSSTVLLVSAPCIAENIGANVDCYNNSAKVSWSSVKGAESYLASAVGEDGHQVSCETNENECNFTELQCGQTYNVSLTAVNTDCQRQAETNVNFTTWPCKPMRIGADLQCGMNAANLRWDKVKGVELYVATATYSMGEIQQCNSTNSTCKFSNLECGKTYKFSVSAYNKMCYSEVSSTVEIQTEPCQPTGLTVTGSCNNETSTLDWSAAEGASFYTVIATGDLGYLTSFQTNETMAELQLPCGQLFTFTVRAQDSQCDSAVSLPEEFKTAPCKPEHVQSSTHCENNLGSVSWASSDGADSYVAFAVGKDGHVHMCNTSTTNCTWIDLHCGEAYTIHVVAKDHLCSSTPSNSTSLRMAPCIPQNLTSSLNCATKVGSLTWNGTETAEFYIVVAESISGHKIQLITNETWTFFSEFMCGQKYFLSVQAVDSVCISHPSHPSQLNSVPCSPTSISSFINCLSNIAVVSWTVSAEAEFYTATVTQEDGQSISCWSDSKQCGMPSLLCGQNYSVTVVASNEQCHSDPSEADSLQSVPCVPTDVTVEINCSNNEANVTWSARDGALFYQASALGTQGSTSLCETTDRTCTLKNLTCGQAYIVQVVGQGITCSSLPSPATSFHSVPCKPNLSSAVLDCFTNSALLDWTNSENVLNHTATAHSINGHVSTCSSNITNCELSNLQCGQTYNVSAVATNEVCSSPPSTSLQVESVPCPPEGVKPVLDCFTNTVRVGWQAKGGADFYIVQASGVEEYESGCETVTQSCSLTELACGVTYNITVTAANSVCNISQSAMTQLKAVPCVPRHVEAQVVCESGAVSVSWEPSKGASSYTTIAQGNGGYASTCNSSHTTCLFNDLLCGLNYSIAVTASDKTCSSAGSSAVELNTVPCVPQQVTSQMVCTNDTGVVSWEETEGVFSYVVKASGPNGHKTLCNSTTTSCKLPRLHCGQLYNLTVTAQDGQCDSSHAYQTLQSVPCRPTNVQAILQCHSNSAAVTWEGSSGARSYLVVGVAEDGSHQTECNSTATHCDLSDLQCGQNYNISVFGLDESCSSAESDKAYMRTGPCAPQNVDVISQCTDGSMAVSWFQNPDAQDFQVIAVSNTGAQHQCNSSGAACTIEHLPCGQKYSVTMVSVRDGCESKPSAPLETSSAPCVPTNANYHLDCVSNSAWVSWDASDGALSYTVLAQEVGGHNSSCSHASSPCRVPDLKCETVYTFYVTAVNKHCHSNHNTSFEVETGPCALMSIGVVAQCNSDTMLVKWEPSENKTHYMVTAEGHDQSFVSCNSSSRSCQLHNIRCGVHYSIIVSTLSDKCSSMRSPPKKITTVPCVPENITAVPSCEDNGATVTWGHSPVATSYQLTATGVDGHTAVCNTSVNNCTLADLHCGQPYNLSITASGDNCTSHPGTALFRTVPCEPSGLSVDLDCETGSATLSWDASKGAVKYFGFAQSRGGNMLFCNSTEISCTVEGLECGNIFNFSVEASDGVCNSSSSKPLELGAAPCAPNVLRVQMRKIGQAHWVLASWDSVNCPDVEYLVEIVGHIQNSPQALMEISSYWVSFTYFELPMPCSTAYNLTVRSRNRAGVGNPSSIVTGVTVPCSPQNVKYSGDSQSAVLSWNKSVFATHYTVYNVSGTSRVQLCDTTEPDCRLTNFDPGTAEVTASNAAGESIPAKEITGPIGARRKRDLSEN